MDMKLTDTALAEQFRDAAYDSGYESGRNHDGDTAHVTAIIRRQELQQEMERRLYAGRQARAELERIRAELAKAGIEDNSDMLAEWIGYLNDQHIKFAAYYARARRSARAWKRAAKGWREAAIESAATNLPTLRVPLLGTLSQDTKPEDFARFAERVNGHTGEEQ